MMVFKPEQIDIEDKYDEFMCYADDVVDKADDVISEMEDYDIYADSSNGNYEDNDEFISEKARDTAVELEKTINELQKLKNRLEERIKLTKNNYWN